MKNQEIFDTVTKHLFAQGMQSVDISVCLFRGPNGTKYAVGCLIPDELYDPKMEGPLSELIDDWTSLSFLKRNYNILDDLQIIHDSDFTWVDDALYYSLKTIAQNYHLNQKVLNEFKPDVVKTTEI